MSTQRDPIKLDLQALLEAERRAPGPDAAARARVLSRLEQTLGLAPSAGGASPADPPSPPPVPAALAPGATLAGPLGLAALAVPLAALLVGGVLWWALEPSSAPSPEPAGASPAELLAATTLPDERPLTPADTLAGSALQPPAAGEDSALPRPGSAEVHAPGAEAGPVVEVASPPARTRRPPRPSGERDWQLAQERAQLEAARSALARGDAPAALQQVQEHARRFPAGQLSEERDALRVLSLVRAGRSAEARQRAEQFRRRYPRSLLLTAVREAAGEPATTP